MASRRPKTKWGDREARLRDICRAGAEALAKEGYANLNMRTVAEGARVSLGTLYTYFTSKEELFAVLYADRLEHLVAEMALSCAGAKTPQEVLVIVAERYFEVYAVFGRELNIVSLVAGEELEAEIAPAVVGRLVSAARQVFATAWTAVARLDPSIADFSEAQRLLAVRLVWATMVGLADHVSGVRQRLHAGTRRELTEFAARVLVAGLESVRRG
ncbi:TetR/AcrR family transcriptional regulator [Pendulispora rubella]|uniref:TetR/AcrR family transcriptional regulator n=1 Tax=Pendulispora rubella TaxID=2741070 RepID=A0ABZ2L2I0_9BACT